MNIVNGSSILPLEVKINLQKMLSVKIMDIRGTGLDFVVEKKERYISLVVMIMRIIRRH